MNNINLLAAIITSFASLLHFYRILINGPMIIGNWNVPMFLSWIGFLVAGFLAVHFWKNIK